jgi:hypothetical protein
MLEVAMFIAYDTKNGILYAKICTSKRNGNTVGKDYINLGRVLDKEKGIYQNRERGIFTYSPHTNTYGKPEDSFVPDAPDHRRTMKLIVDFGDSFLLDAFVRKSGLVPAIDAIGYGNPDTLYAMIYYYVLCQMANCHAMDWWAGNYVRVICPNANLSSQRLSDFLAAIGDEGSQRDFFREYLKLLTKKQTDGTNILIDSTGLPNSIHFPLTAISNHNGDIEEEVRLIYVTQQETGFPLYFRYCPGNVVDTSTMTRTIAELNASGVNTKFAIFDAGYSDGKNLRALYECDVSFITRLNENTVIYKKLVSENVAGIDCEENLVKYNGRYAFVKCVECALVPGHNAYAYVCIDIDRKGSEVHKLFRRAVAKKLPDRDVYGQMSTMGLFVLVSTRRVAKSKILPAYYTRQQIEQIFDIGKNYASMLPLRVHREETFRGHLLLTFVACIIVKMIQDKLKPTSYNPISMFLNLRNQKCKIYTNQVITQETFKKANDCYELFGIKCPVAIQLKQAAKLP